MHMLTWKHITIAHTKASIEAEGIPPKNIKTDMIWKQIMSRLITRIHAIQYTTQDRKSENKKRSEAGRILTLQYE